MDALTATLAAASSEGEVESEHRLTSLADRLDAVERDGVTVASEIGRAAAFWASQIRELEGKIEALSSAAPASKPGDDASNALVADLMGRVQTLEVERTAESADTASRRELSELRNLVGQLELRLAERERELETTHDAAADLADVLTRVEMLEQVDGPPGSTSAGDGSDGRLRIELRALELRMDHAEAAARENREAVLVQLERLASRIEWRLGQLESEHAAGEEDQPDDSATLGQVVPIHGEA